MEGANSSGLHLTGIVLAVLVLASGMFRQEPLQTDRPDHSPFSARTVETGFIVPARLWEDPFEAIERYCASAPDGKPKAGCSVGPPGRSLAQELLKLNQAGKTFKLILATQITSPYAEVREHRIRTRAAVLAGLARKNYAPLESEHIGLVSIKDADLGLIRLPYEFFTPGVAKTTEDKSDQDRPPPAGEPNAAPTAADLIVLLWLPENLLSTEQPLVQLENIVVKAMTPIGKDESTPPRKAETTPPGEAARPDRLKTSIANTLCTRFGNDGQAGCAIPVLGPMSSGTLKTLAGHLDRKAGKKAVPFRFYAATPTAPGISANGPADAPSNGSTALVRTIATDDALIALLVDELALRGADPVCTQPLQELLPRPPCRKPEWSSGKRAAVARKAHVVLISEWDTKYGRTLPLLFCREVNQRLAVFDPGLVPENEDECPSWIHQRGYERGLDGKVPLLNGRGRISGSEKTAAVSEGALRQLIEGAGLTQMEPAVGPRQLDYIRRMATELKRFDRELNTNDQGSIRAFGILGNDVYDKLLIIQALREHFPNHLYFTTDLDARFLTPKHYPTVRNLIVASAYGLQLNRDLQDFVPPFRNVYQTSNYLTTLAILSKQPHVEPQKPRIFEVGRNQFVNLSPATDEEKPGCRYDDLNDQGIRDCSVHPSPGTQRATLVSFITQRVGPISLLAALLGFFLIVRVVPRMACYAYEIVDAVRVTLREDLKTVARLITLGTADGSGPINSERIRYDRFMVHAAVLLLPLLLLALAYMNVLSEQEPFALAAGVSLWPAELIRLLANMLCLIFIFLVYRQVANTDITLAKQFILPCRLHEDYRATQGMSGLMRWYLLKEMPRDPEALSVPDRNREMFGDAPQEKEANAESVVRTIGQREDEQARKVWRLYQRLAHPRERHRRVRNATLIFFSVYFLLLFFVAPPPIPYRGIGTYVFSLLNGFILTFLFGYLLLLVVDETTLCVGLIRNLSARWVCWPKFAEQKHLANSRLSAIEHQLAEDISTAEFIAERSKTSGDIVWYPFVILILGVVSLSTRFDNMATPTVVVGLIGFALLFALSSSFHLRQGAKEARNLMTEKLEQWIAEEKHAEEQRESGRLEMLKQRIERLHGGAFRRIYEDPIARALAWLFSISAVIITEYYSI